MRYLNYSRFLGWIDQLALHGSTIQNGVSRLAATDEDKLGRDQLVHWMNQFELAVEIDEIGNVFGTLPSGSSQSALMIGSHIDSVGNGGKLDGAYGVLAGMEIIASYRDSDERPARDLTVAAFTNEEGVRFQPDMMGSLVFAGGLEVETARSTLDKNGIKLGDELDRIGYSGALKPGKNLPGVYLELHIEQGPILEQEQVSIGAVDGVQGIYWTKVTYRGQSNHAGTTPMSMRLDAAYGASCLAVEVRKLTDEISGLRGTVGSLDVKPNLINVVACESIISVDLRNANRANLRAAQQQLESAIHRIAQEEGLEMEVEELVRFDPVSFDEELVRRIERTASSSEFSVKRMVSGAGHDAQMMARVCPSAMIFVPSIKGISHNPEESTSVSDLIAGLDVLSGVVGNLMEKQ